MFLGITKKRAQGLHVDEVRCDMRLKNVLIVADDLEKAKKFYRDLFGLLVVSENEGNIILTEGLVLQDLKVWQEAIGKEIVPQNNASLLYFEEGDIESFVKRLEAYEEKVEYLTPLTELPWGQKVVRVYDPFGNLIEVRG